MTSSAHAGNRTTNCGLLVDVGGSVQRGLDMRTDVGVANMPMKVCARHQIARLVTGAAQNQVTP